MNAAEEIFLNGSSRAGLQSSRQREPDEERRELFMHHILNSTTTRTQGWQTDCWNWAKARMPFELYGIQTKHLAFCRTLSSACHVRFHSRRFRNQAVALFEPSSSH